MPEPTRPEDARLAGGDGSDGGAADLDTTAAMVRAESDHLDSTLRALVTRLSSVPGLNLTVSYHHGRVRRLLGDLPYVNDLNRQTGPIHKIVVAVGEHSYWLQAEGGSLSCGREPGSAEAGQMDEQLTFTIWAKALFDDIARQNLVNHDSMVALRRLVEHDLLD
jgi:hypothetical protein